MIIKDKYKVLEIIGSGTYSIVYKAQHIEKNTIVSIKVNKKNDIISKKLLEHEINIYLLLKKYKIQNVISIKSFGIYDNSHYIIMDYLPYTIEEYINKDKSKQHNIYLQMFNILKIIHKYDIVHRDIKPDNFMISSNGNVYLIDMGLSSVCKETQILNKPIGTPLFYSYNIYNNIYEKKDDIISLFYVIFYIITNGDLPWNNIKLLNEEKKNQVFSLLKQYSDYKNYYNHYNNEELNWWINKYTNYLIL